MEEQTAGRLAELDTILDTYERGLGLAFAGDDEVTEEGRRLIDLPPSAVRKLSPMDASVGAYTLQQFAMRLQRAVNREQGRVTWACSSINRMIAKKLGLYTGYSLEERRLKAVADDDVARKLDEIRVHAQLRLDRVSFLAGKVESLAKTLLSIKNTKTGGFGDE